MSSQRQLRVAEEVRHILSEIIQRGDLPEGSLSTPVTVSRVDISPDLQNALVFVMPLGGLHKEETLDVLKTNKWYLRKNLGQKVTLRRVPQLHFILDETFDAAEKIDQLIKAGL